MRKLFNFVYLTFSLVASIAGYVIHSVFAADRGIIFFLMKRASLAKPDGANQNRDLQSIMMSITLK